MKRLGIQLAKWLLKSGNLSQEETNILLGVIVGELRATPFSAIIEFNDQQNLVIHGKPLSLQEAIALREHAIAALNNKALTLVLEQARYAALNHAAENANDITQLLFARAAIWLGKQQTLVLQMLAQRGDEPTV